METSFLLGGPAPLRAPPRILGIVGGGERGRALPERPAPTLHLGKQPRERFAVATSRAGQVSRKRRSSHPACESTKTPLFTAASTLQGHSELLRLLASTLFLTTVQKKGDDANLYRHAPLGGKQLLTKTQKKAGGCRCNLQKYQQYIKKNEYVRLQRTRLHLGKKRTRE